MHNSLGRIIRQILAVGLAFALLPMGAAAAQTAPSISGRVHIAGQAGGLAGMTVDVYDVADPANPVWTGSATTDAEGAYAFESLPDGSYTVSAYGGDHFLAERWAPGTDDGSVAQVHTVLAGSTQTADIAYTGVVGTVSATGPFDGGSVTVYDAVSGMWIDSTWFDAPGATSAAFFLPAPAGDYKVAYDLWRNTPSATGTMWSGNARSQETATTVTVANDAAAGVAPVFGTITGSVRGPDGQGAVGGSASAWLPPATQDDWWMDVASSDVDPVTGAYQLFVAPGVDHVVGFGTWDGSTYASYYHPVADVQEDAQTVAADTTAPTSGINGQFRSVSGTVTDAAGAPVASAGVYAGDQDGHDFWDYADSTTTDASGNYTLLTRPGSFYIGADRYTELSTYLTWFGGSRVPANLVDTTTNQTNIDLRFRVISGQVVVEGNPAQPLAGISVDVFEPVTENYVASAQTDVNGNYEVGVPSGTYVVGFSEWSDTVDWSQYYDRARRFSAATPVVVTNDASATGINGLRRVFSGSSTISGTIGVPSGMTVDGGYVEAWNYDTGEYFSGSANADGTYSIAVPAGEYEVSFHVEANDYKSSGYWATDVIATEAVPGSVNPTFTAVTGSVTVPAGVTYASAEIFSNGRWAGGWAAVQDDGTYTALVVPGDGYAATFYAERWDGSDYAEGWGYSGNAQRASEAATFSVPASGHSGVNHRFNLVTGQILDSNGDGVDGAQTLLVNGDAGAPTGDTWYESDDNEERAYAYAKLGGGYSAPVSAGQYKARFSVYDWNTDLSIERWFDAKTSYSTANVVTVPDAADVAGVNGLLEGDWGTAIGVIKGSVLMPSALELDGWVYAWNHDTGNSYWASVSGGQYSLDVIPGTYTVEIEVENHDGTTGGQLYKDVTVAAHETASANAWFAPVTGTVTVPAGYDGYGWIGQIGNASGGWGNADDTGAFTAVAPVNTEPVYFAGFEAGPDWGESSTNYGYGWGYLGGARQADAHKFGLSALGQSGVNHRFNLMRGTVSGMAPDAQWRDVSVVNADANAPATRAELSEDDYRGWAGVNDDGTYALPVSAGNSFKVAYEEYAGSGIALMSGESTSIDGLQEQWYDQKPSYETANVVTVGATANTLGVNFALSRGEIRGTVTASGTTTRLANVCVTAWDGANKVGSATTRSDGTYTLSVAAGTYTLRFIHCVESPVYKDRWFPASDTQSGATAVTVADAQVVTGQDIALVTGFVPAQPVATTSTTGTAATTTVDPRTGESKTRIPYADSDATAVSFTYIPGCVEGSPSAPVQLRHNGIAYPMTAGSGGSYTGTIPAGSVTNADVTVTFFCGETEVERKLGVIELYDPSGDVTDASTGQAVKDATVTLYRVPGWEPKSSPTDTAPNTCQSHLSKDPATKWNQVVTADNLANAEMADPNSGMISPTVNPQQTNGVGRYGWDVARGCWFVTVSKTGYTTYTSPLVGVPPAVTDLDVALQPIVVTPPPTDPTDPTDPTPPPTAKATLLTSAAKPARVVFGKSTVFSGKLADKASKAGLPSRNVVVQTRRQRANKTWTTWAKLATVKTSAKGLYTFRHKTPRNSQYRARFLKAGVYTGSTSPVRAVNVAATATATLSKARVLAGKPVVFAGKVAPNLKRKAVYLQQKVGRRWKDVARQALTRTSTFRFVIKRARKASYSYRLRIPAYPMYVKGFSPVRTVKVI